MTPRLALPEEAAALRVLVEVAYAEHVPEGGPVPLPMLDDYAARIAAGQAWVLPGEDGLAALLVLEAGPDGLLLDNVAVAPGARGRGHGAALLAFAEAEARARGHVRLWLYTNIRMTRNIAWYLRTGFIETHRAEEHGRHRVFLEKRL